MIPLYPRQQRIVKGLRVPLQNTCSLRVEKQQKIPVSVRVTLNSTRELVGMNGYFYQKQNRILFPTLVKTLGSLASLQPQMHPSKWEQRLTEVMFPSSGGIRARNVHREKNKENFYTCSLLQICTEQIRFLTINQRMCKPWAFPEMFPRPSCQVLVLFGFGSLQLPAKSLSLFCYLEVCLAQAEAYSTLNFFPFVMASMIASFLITSTEVQLLMQVNTFPGHHITFTKWKNQICGQRLPSYDYLNSLDSPPSELSLHWLTSSDSSMSSYSQTYQHVFKVCAENFCASSSFLHPQLQCIQLSPSSSSTHLSTTACYLQTLNFLM